MGGGGRRVEPEEHEVRLGQNRMVLGGESWVGMHALSVRVYRGRGSG